MFTLKNMDLHNRGFVPLHPQLSSAGYNIYIHSRALAFLNEAIQDNYASFKLIKKLVAMRSNPRPWDGGIKKGTADHRQLAVDGIWVNYFIESGCVCIEEIDFNPEARARHEPAGLHKVEKINGIWTITDPYIKEINTVYAAVNGQSNIREKAASDIMPIHLKNAYNDESIDEYTLFHNPTVNVFADTYESFRDKAGFTTPMTKRFANLLHKTQQNNKITKWVTHSQGGAIFTQAVNHHNKTIRAPLDKHTVYFQASANNMYMTKKILKKAGIKLHKDGYNNSPIDGVPQVLGVNALTDALMKPGMKSLARLAISPIALLPGLFPLAVLGPGLSTHTRPYNGMKAYGKQVTGTTKNMVNKLVKRFV